MLYRIGNTKLEITDKERDLLRATASNDAQGIAHRKALAQVVAGAFKSGILEPDLLGNVYTRVPLEAGAEAKFPLDLYSPTKEEWYKAFIVPKEGALPIQVVEGDEIYVPCYKVANQVAWNLDYARDARWDIVSRAMDVFMNGFTRRLNDDGWHVILAAAKTNTLQRDTSATSGVFTKTLLTTMMTGIKRLTGGRGSKVTDLYLSPEGLADIRNFDYQVIDDVTMRDLLSGAEGLTASLFGVRIHELEELGYGQEYNDYLVNTLGQAYGSGDEEFCVGLDLAPEHRDSFVMPVREDLKVFDDVQLHRSAQMGVYGWTTLGFGALDNRRAILGSF